MELYKDQVLQLQEELLAKCDTNLHQQEEITSLTGLTGAVQAQNIKVRNGHKTAKHSEINCTIMEYYGSEVHCKSKSLITRI
jgi:hypothetical protein